MLLATDPRKALVSRIAPYLHAEQRVDAARILAEYSGVRAKIESETQAIELLFSLVHWCFENNGYEEVAQLFWPDSMFNPNPRSTKLIWDTFEKSTLMLLIGSASMSKSFSTGVRLFLEWVRDPQYTNVKVLGPSEQHLEDNLFSHLVTLHKSCSLPLPGEINQLFIGLDPRSRKSAISGVVIPIGKKRAGRLQGAKRQPRKAAHPVFGILSRLFVFGDEIENIPIGLWPDIDNIIANADSNGGFKFIGAYNPADITNPVAARAEPVAGWSSVDIDTSESWTSKRGWNVLRLDAFKCENVVENRIVYPGLQTKQGLEILIANAGGYNTPGYYTMARAMYPPTGVSYSVITDAMLDNVRANLVFIDKPRRVAGADIALEGGDKTEIYVGRFGLSSGVKYLPTVEHPEGKFVQFKNERGEVSPRLSLQIDQNLTLPPAGTVERAKEIRRILQSLGVEPDWVMIDRTGNGAGVHDVLKEIWSPAIRGVNYSESPTNLKIASEDTDTAENVYDRVNSELYFATRKWIEFGYIKIDPSVEFPKLKEQLVERLFQPGKKYKVESKTEYKSRHSGESPDKADALTLVIHAVRCSARVVIGMLSANSPGSFSGDDDQEDYYRIGATDRASDDL